MRRVEGRYPRTKPETRHMVIMYYLSGKTHREISGLVSISDTTISNIINAAMEFGDIKSDLRIYSPSPDIKPHDYSGASEYTLHFKGAEFEDSRPEELRELGARHPFRYRV